MHTFSSRIIVDAVCCFGIIAAAGSAAAQSRTPPDGSSLAQTPPIDQRKQQFDALPSDQKNSYIQQEQKNDPATATKP